jgi:hypothetical protein
MVETCLLQSDKGIAIALLNWSDTCANQKPENNNKSNSYSLSQLDYADIIMIDEESQNH